MVEENLPQKTACNFIGVAQKFGRVPSKVLADVVEIDDVAKVERDGQSVDDDVEIIDNALQYFIGDEFAWKTIIYNEWQVESESNHHVETHSIKIELQGFTKGQLVEKLDVEDVKQPSAQTERENNGY